MCVCFLVRDRRRPRSTRTDTHLPYTTLCRSALCRVHYEFDNSEAARAVLSRAVALDAESPEAHYWHGLVLYGLGRNHDAVVAFGKTIALDDGAADAYFYRAHSFAEMGRFAEAVADLDKAIEQIGRAHV